jgi:hypothetical protein
MLRKIIFGLMVGLLFVTFNPGLLEAENSECREIHKAFAPKNSRIGPLGKLLPGQILVQARIILDSSTVVKVVEYPQSGPGFDDSNSTIIVEQNSTKKVFRIKDLIKYGSIMRLVEYATVCNSPDDSTIFLGFDGGSTGDFEGFAVIHSSPNGIEVMTLPYALQGRIVINRSTPDELELWSATDSDMALCGACKKHYFVRECRVGQKNVECIRRVGLVGPLNPDAFMSKRIDIH